MVEIDAIAKRYGKLPSELCRLDLYDYQFNLLVTSEVIAEENKQTIKNNRRNNGKRNSHTST